jgi:hypothetical protein
MKQDTARQEFHGQQREALDRRHARERLSFEADQRRESLPPLPRKQAEKTPERAAEANANRPPPVHEADRVTIIDPARAQRQQARRAAPPRASGQPGASRPRPQPEKAEPKSERPQARPDFAAAAEARKPGRVATFFSGLKDRFSRTAAPETPSPEAKPDFGRAAETPPPSPAPPEQPAAEPSQPSLKEAYAERAVRNERETAPDRGPGRTRGRDPSP